MQTSADLGATFTRHDNTPRVERAVGTKCGYSICTGHQGHEGWLPAQSVIPRNQTATSDVWSAVGRDEGHNGAEFSTPLRVSSVASTPPQVGAGDDFSWIIADGHHVHVGWGDSRNRPLGGGIQTWYARIPFETFEGDEH